MKKKMCALTLGLSLVASSLFASTALAAGPNLRGMTDMDKSGPYIYASTGVSFTAYRVDKISVTHYLMADTATIINKTSKSQINAYEATAGINEEYYIDTTRNPRAKSFHKAEDNGASWTTWSYYGYWV
ncbi:hypothetical protein IHV12_19790 [Fictibacillus sp. 7GRE50]|uniref:hypothetical protein n=1 Tax=Fictibacillus sp. 7GRE50 TaxID=2745878 RepID=UPI0018CFD890|nr:hypothetical protein [Fictibacillus sp. 7GRE50]MBH0167171.1 hypothetical protein [Fictibacillus sp. 7GRE50]